MPKRTPSGRKTAVADVEEKLKGRYGTETPAARAKVFGTLNKIGLKRGSKTTAKGMRPARRGKRKM